MKKLSPGQWVTIKEWGRIGDHLDSYATVLPLGMRVWYINDAGALLRVSTDANGRGALYGLLLTTILEPCDDPGPLTYKFT